MLQTFLSRIGWFILLIILQVTVLNHVHIMGYATPMPYVYSLLILSSATPRWLYIACGFTLGLVIDLFSNTPGMASGSLCAVGLCAPLLLRLSAPIDKDDEALQPSVRTMSWGGFLQYAFSLSLLHCSLFFIIETFSFIRPDTLLINIGGSTALTLLFIIAFEMLRTRRA